jgi:hypothetical protein
VPSKIEDYAIIGDTQTAALVSREGSIDWLCLPRFDSGACFAALLGTRQYRYRLQPHSGVDCQPVLRADGPSGQALMIRTPKGLARTSLLTVQQLSNTLCLA